MFPLLEPGEPGPVEVESGAMSVPVVSSLGLLLPVGAPPVLVVSASFALLASFAGRSGLHATSTRPRVEARIAICSRTIFCPFVTAR